MCTRVFRVCHRLGVAARRNPVGVLTLVVRVVVEKALDAVGFTASQKSRELLFQEKQLAGIGEFSARMDLLLLPDTQRQMFPEDLLPFFRARAAEMSPSRMTVVDVGAGLVSFLSWGHHSHLFELTAADPLAEEYRRLLERYGHEDALGDMRLVQCAAEDLASVLERDSCDIVHSSNALDHTNSPRKALEQMVAITRWGGHVVITGRSHEGTLQGWDAIHQHDLFVHNRALWRAGRDGKSSPLAEGLPLSTVHSNDPAGFHDWMVIVFRKE